MTSAALAPAAPRGLDPLARLETLCDRGSVQLLRTGVRSRRLGDRARDGDGTLAATGTVGGRPVACYAQDASFMGGSLGEEHARSQLMVLRLAAEARVPVVGFVESAGARLQEGLAALSGYGEIFAQIVALSGRVPQISVIGGTCAGGGAYAPALTDFVVMTEASSMFLTGPGVIREVTGEEVTAGELGGPRVQARNGVCHLVADDDHAAALLVRELLGYLPSHSGLRPPRTEPVAAPGGDPGRHVPRDARKVYDVRDVAAELVDGGELLEYGERWARNIVCAFARIDGRPVGIVANQPRRLGGAIDAEAAQKGARFVRSCHLFGLPLLTLVDTPGFLPGTRQEQSAVIRHGAKLVHAFAEARVPKLSVVLRKSFGGAHIAMNSRALGAHLVLAWPDSELGVMGGAQAVGVVHRRELAAAGDPESMRMSLASAYADEHLGARVAAIEGTVDEVIAPTATRERLVAALHFLGDKQLDKQPAGNVPL
ncbi:MAG: acyl-CoA carboxylase subunit beta [Thermoleophilaceae bacterium]